MAEIKEVITKSIMWALSPTDVGSGPVPVTHQL